MSVKTKQISTDSKQSFPCRGQRDGATTRSPAESVLHLLFGRHPSLAYALVGTISLALPIIPARADPATQYRLVAEATTMTSVARSSLSSSNASASASPTAPRPTGDLSIRAFKYHASDEELAELRRRISMTKWPSRELVSDASQGVQLATIQELARYWQTDYDWRRFETSLNALPQFMTTIDGVDIHFIHVRSKHPNALPIIVTHGWPGSIIEQLKIIDPLTNPTAHGGTGADAFDVVIPSFPGHGFSGAAHGSWLGPCSNRTRLGRVDEAAWATLDMSRKGAIGVTQSRSRWRYWGRRNWSAFTQICLPRFPMTSRTRSRPAADSVRPLH